jgi:transcriptional regulator with XRE-family HTH domain
MESPLSILRERVESKSQRAVAQELGVSPQYLCDVLAERREPGKSILDALGLEKKVSYRKINGRGAKKSGA